MTKHQQILPPWTDEEKQNILFPESDNIRKLRNKAMENYVPVVSKSLGSFLQALVVLYQPQNFLEVGAGYGLASILMAQACPHTTGFCMEINQERFFAAQDHIKSFNLDDRVSVVLGDIREPKDVQKISNVTYDLILVDASKGQYWRLLKDLIPLLNQEGLFVFTDIYLRGRLVSGEISLHREKTSLVRMRAFLQDVFALEGFSAYVLDIDDGILLLRRKGGGGCLNF